MDDAMTALPLVFDAPRRGKPPRHLADLTREEARAAVTELGQPAFRADQLARHFYRGRHRPGADDRPAGRGPARTSTEALLPGLLTAGPAPVRRRRAHPQDAVAAARRRAGRERAHALPRPGHRLHLQPGRLRHGLPVLRHRPERPDPQPLRRRDHRPGGRRRGGDGQRRDPRRPRPAVQRRLHGHGRAAGQLRPGPQDPRRPAHPGPARARARRSARSPSPPSGLVPAIRRLTEEGLQRHPRGQPARARRRAARHPGADQHPLEGRRGASRPPTPTPAAPAAATPSSTR